MNTRELFEAIGAMDDDLILEADKLPVRPRRNWRPLLWRGGPLAACLCLAVGAVLWQGQRSKVTLDTALPEAAAAAPEEAAQGTLRSEAAVDENAQAKTYDGGLSLYNGPEASVSALPALLTDLMDKGAGVYALDTTPQPADRTRLLDRELPDTVPVYRSMAAGRTIDLSGMYGRMRSMLQALGLDTALADDAVYTGLTQAEAEAQTDTLANNGGSEGAELALWADAGSLALEVAPCEAWPEGLTLTADNTGTVTAQVPGAEADATRLTSAEALAAVQAAWPDVVALAGEDTASLCYTGTDGAWHARFYNAAYNAAGGIENSDLDGVELAVDASGQLCRVVWHNADLTQVAGEYAPLTRAQAEDLLRQDLFLTDGGSLDGDGVLENLADVRLYYPESRACAWYLPYWCFTADEGASEEDPGRHLYCEYLVPAVSVDDLTALQDAG